MDTQTMLHKLITSKTLKKLSGSKVFQRGEEYFADDTVERLRATGDRITARVAGSELYQVELQVAGGELDYGCTCPHAADGFFCKHCVAVGLAWLAAHPDGGKSGNPGSGKKRRDPWSMIKEYLADQPREVLLDLLLESVQRDDRLYQALELKAERMSDKGNEVKSFRRAIDIATKTHGFIDWREVGTYAGNLDQVVDSLAELLQPATAASLVELAEYAIERAEKALEQIDDSSGSIGEIVIRLGELHHQACLMARPAPAKLAERLFRLETTLPFGLCRFDPFTYREVLGKKGLERYRQLAETEWSTIKPRQAGEGYDGHRSTMTRIMERLAEADGDTAKLVEIKARDLSSSYRYLEIAETWTKAGEPEKALEWAERGLKAFPARPDNRLRDFLVNAYLKRKRNDEAWQLTWVQFEEHPSLEHYKKLQGVAKKLGIWPEQRQRALDRVAEEVFRNSARTNNWRAPSQPNYSLRLEIALWEKNLEEAWTTAQQGLCNRNLLITLADKFETIRPKDAVDLYQRVVPSIVDETNNTAYAEAIKLVRKVGTLLLAMNQEPQFSLYLTELETRFKAKRNFMKGLRNL